MISVITPTARQDGIDVVAKALRRQTYRDFEWIIISPNGVSHKQADLLLEDPPKNEGDYWSFNKAMNKALRRAKGDIIVSVQDYTFFDPDGLEKFKFHIKKNPKAVISGVGDKYNDENFVTKVWEDPRKRKDYGTFYECYPNDIEFNYCALPKKAFYEVGGFDEYLDKYAGMDHISVQERLDDIGYKFYLDQTNESYSLTHGRLEGWDNNHAMHGGYQQRKASLKAKGKWPRLDFLNPNKYNENNKVKEGEPQDRT